MPKTKSPLLSFQAHGSLGDAVTFQHRSKTDFVRAKPTPTDARTLAQVYHRWDYQDYAHQWHALSASAKLIYRKLGTRQGFTGFNYFMREKLLTLPDLMGRWHLDNIMGASALDTSKNGNNGTVYGATPTKGLIDNALSFDGGDDYLNIPHSPELEPTSQITIETFALPVADRPNATGIVAKGRQAHSGYVLYFHTYFRGYIKGVDGHSYTGLVPRTLGQWHHLIFTYDAVLGGIIYLNGLQSSTSLAQGNIDYSTYPSEPLRFATSRLFARKVNARIDEVRIYDRVLTPAEVLVHSKRRYP